MEYIIGNIISAKVRHHRLELALVPAGGNTGSDIESVTGNGEEILTLTSAIRDVVLESTLFSGDASISLTIRVPCQWCSVMIGTCSVVMIKDCGLVFRSSGEVSLVCA